MRRFLFIAATVLFAFGAQAAPKTYQLKSPDGRIEVTVEAGEGISYMMTCCGDVILEKSPAAMYLTDGTVFGGAQKVSKVSRRTADQTIPTPVYRKSEVRDNYNELTLKFKKFSVVFRAYDEGMAYRFISNMKKPFEVAKEVAAFAFPEDWNMWVPYVNQHLQTLESQLWNSFENRYKYVSLSAWDKERYGFLPLMVDAPKGRKVVITEADLMDYPGMYLYNSNEDSVLEAHFASYPKTLEQGGHNNLQMIVKSREAYIARYEGDTAFPWRIVSVSESDVQMADNDMVYKLATPAEEGDWSWVKPGKVAWDWWNAWNLYGVDFRAGINNDTYKYYIDFASSHGIQYVILDEGWAVNKKADLFMVIPEINLEELVAYATERNVGLILWAGYWAFDRDMEQVCEHYSKMGIKGFKVDFMDRDDQMMVDFHRRAAEMGAKYGLLIDFHGTYKPTGLHRTYPNVINFEGVFGLEQMKWSKESVDQVTYDVTVPYIRMMAGPMDYTQGAMRNSTKNNYRPVNSEAMSQGTRCRQLAQYVIFDSPLNMLCDSPSNYMNEKECTEFISNVPEVWDETRGLAGEVGKYIAMAKRKGSEWYVGAMTDWSKRSLTLDLAFLPEGEYVVELYKDGINADRAARDYKKDIVELPADRKLEVNMMPGGGFAAKIVKK